MRWPSWARCCAAATAAWRRRALLREALDVAHRAGAAPLAERAETELRATGARPRRAVLTGVEALTASERRVAELAADGLTNREIAQALFVTMRTVEGHLTSVFAKLDVRSRAELPRRARSRRQAAARRPSPSSATAISRIRNFWTLPVTVIGKASTNFQ